MNLAIKHAPRPVVVAPQGLALGGGCEVCLHGARIQAAAEAYIGLVETGVGLIPAGGGSKEMIVRANEHAAGGAESRPFSRVQARFRNSRHGQSFHQRRRRALLGLLRPSRPNLHEPRPPGRGR